MRRSDFTRAPCAIASLRRPNLACAVHLVVIFTLGCASKPPGNYGVDSIEWKGVEQMSRESLEVCLATKEREPWKLRLGLSKPTCRQPPFDVNVPDITLLTLP